MGQLDTVLGAFLAASWVNGMLWAIELRQAFHFFTTYEHDGPWLRLAVTALLLSDSVASLAIFATVYLYCVSNWGSIQFLIEGNIYGLVAVTIAGGISVLILHSFLILRVYRLSHRISLSMALGILALSAFATSIVGAIELGTLKVTPEGLTRLRICTIVFAATSGGADIFIAGTLIAYLQMAQRKLTHFRESILSRPLKMLIRAALESGGVPAAWAIIAMALYLWNDNVDAGSGMLFSQPQETHHTSTLNTSGACNILSSLQRKFNGNDRPSGEKRAHDFPGRTMAFEIGAPTLSYPAAETRRGWDGDGIQVIVLPSHFPDSDYESLSKIPVAYLTKTDTTTM